MRIRLLNASDAKLYWELRGEALQQHPKAFATSYEEFIQREPQLDQIKKNLSTPGNYTFGAFDNGELMGMVTLVQEKAIKLRHRANIVGMYVTPRQRRLGAGKALLKVAIDQAKAIPEIVKLNLSVVSTNENAKHLYLSLGFEVYGREEKALRVGTTFYDEDHMVLFLRK